MKICLSPDMDYLAPGETSGNRSGPRLSPFPLMSPLQITPASPLPTPTSPMPGQHSYQQRFPGVHPSPYCLAPPSHTDFFPSPSPSDHQASPGGSTVGMDAADADHEGGGEGSSARGSMGDIRAHSAVTSSKTCCFGFLFF